ncbi:Histone-lysine N-methyltransferase, H3 lysine-79 specific [Frankliniella fusca]|uniref:Histone-lysine N-methyltransferase, H3 lysine-79 specific n=1 Tax=Frankliniella fusca TaxID=407009 RepID=A0AAE1LFF8_9NEOP|nr:Histone-lysine N-methyltransferase, H3 lysine-79 specific [Frankliniella fusca]
MDRKKKLVLLGQQKYAEKNSLSKRKVMSPDMVWGNSCEKCVSSFKSFVLTHQIVLKIVVTFPIKSDACYYCTLHSGKENPTPNGPKKSTSKEATDQSAPLKDSQNKESREVHDKDRGLASDKNDSSVSENLTQVPSDAISSANQLVTPEHDSVIASKPAHKKKGICNDENNFTNERLPKTVNTKEEKGSKVQRALLFETEACDPRKNHPPKMKSGIKFNRMTNVGFDTPPCSPFSPEEKETGTSGNIISCTSSLNPKSDIDGILASKLSLTPEKGIVTACARRKVALPLAKPEGLLLNQSAALSNIVESYVWSDEDTQHSTFADTCGSVAVDGNSNHILNVDENSNTSNVFLEQSCGDAITPVKSSFASFSSDCNLEPETSPPFEDHLKAPEKYSYQGLSSDCDSDAETSQQRNDHLIAPKDDLPETVSNVFSNKDSNATSSRNSNGDSTAEGLGTLQEDLQLAGIDVGEEIIIMPLSPLKLQDTEADKSPPSQAEGNQTSVLQDQEENQQNLHEDREDPDDPDFVIDDATAPHNLSGLDSDAGSAGESPKPRRSNPKNWKRNVSKEKNSKGLKHVSTRGKEKPARDVITDGCGESCKRKCHGSLTLEQRQKINKNYWSIGNCSRQWDYLSRHVKILPVKRRTSHTEEPYRKRSYEYYLTVDNLQVQVCQQMFLKTLNISVSRIKLALKKMVNRDGVISPDKRGRVGSKRKIHPSTISSVKSHIESYPTYESHYTRRSSKKKYLDARLNVSKMYRNYAASRLTNTPHIATARQYEDIFRREYKHKLGFYKPKKDQCGTCLRWKNLSPEDKLNDEAKVQQEKHINNKETARKIKDDNIKLGTDDKQVCVASFDLQKVFFCPYGENGEYIFRRKLRCYNLSVFQSVTKVGYCFVWDETTGKKGAVEMSSCVWSFIETKVAEGYTKFYFVSDNCWNQNKNGIIFAMYNMASIKFGIEIHHTYLEKGHTQMECDSIHSLIERRCKNLKLCSPQAWYGVIRTAKVPDKRKGSPYHPYVVKVMTKDNIFDFKAVMNEQNLSKIPKSKVRQITISQNVAKFRREFDGPEEEVSLLLKRPGRPFNFKTYVLKKMYSKRIPLKADQLKDLLWLCDQKHIPEPDSQFFYNLAQESQMDLPAEGDGEGDDMSDAGTESDDSDSDSEA